MSMSAPAEARRHQKGAGELHGRLLEIKSWMVKLNQLNDVVQLDDILVDLKLTPDVLEIPVPRYYVEDRQKVRAARRALGELRRRSVGSAGVRETLCWRERDALLAWPRGGGTAGAG